MFLLTSKLSTAMLFLLCRTLLRPQIVEEQELRDAQMVVKVDSKSAKGRKMSKKQMVNNNSKPDPCGRRYEAVISEASRKTMAAAAKKRKLVEVRASVFVFVA